MPEVKDIGKARIAFIYTDIGRGHPSYLDGTIDRFEAMYPDIPRYVTDLFALSTGSSLSAWRAVRRMYRLGGRGGWVTALYGLARKMTGSGSGGMLHHLLGRDLIRLTAGLTIPIVVAHPILARILSGRNRVVYQHGELAAPAEAMVTGCRKILVPLESTAAVFRQSGVPPDAVNITGQGIEPELADIAADAHRARLDRLAGSDPLVVALFSSGAYPAEHLDRLKHVAISLYRAGHQIVFFAGRSGRIAGDFVRHLARHGITAGIDFGKSDRVLVIGAKSRREENRRVADLFPSLDIFFAPAHERVNWSVGLGLPQFILRPHIGSYAPLNAAIAAERGVAIEVADISAAADMAGTIDSLRQNGRLKAMAINGFGTTDIRGFERSAEILRHMAGGTASGDE